MNYTSIKSILDYLFLILISPLFLFLMIFFSVLIKIYNPNEKIFFVQGRVGYKGKIFKMYKFRTMYSSTPNNLFTSHDDPRVDKLGVILRRFRIDEIPQFINIFLGEMSLIGPRPEQIHFVEELLIKFGPKFHVRHDVLPGITGLAQIEHGYVSDFNDYKVKLDYDIIYVNNLSLMQDIKIFVKTIFVVFLRLGSR